MLLEIYITYCCFCLFIQITEDTIWSQVAIANIKKQCIIVSNINPDLWVTQEDGDIPQLPSFMDDLCPNNCSNNGNCADGMFNEADSCEGFGIRFYALLKFHLVREC